MSKKVTRIYSEGPVSRSVNDAVFAFDKAMAAAIDEAQRSGIPQGMLIGMLQIYVTEQSLYLLDARDADLQ